MADDFSYVFDFQRVDDFFDRWNVNFKTTGDFDVANKFQITLCSYSSDNISDCLIGGVIDTSNVTIYSSQDCTLNWSNEEVSLGADVTFNLSTNIVPCKALFIRHKASGVVLGYCINGVAFDITNTLKFSKDTILWSIKDGE